MQGSERENRRRTAKPATTTKDKSNNEEGKQMGGTSGMEPRTVEKKRKGIGCDNGKAVGHRTQSRKQISVAKRCPTHGMIAELQQHLTKTIIYQ